jgi:DtxR family transcriptional regulator, Mn-dependent transcriptional regulator
MASPAEEEYLRAFYYLQEKKGVARLTDLAFYLKVSKAGVSEMISSLSSRGLVRHQPYSPAMLTQKGLSIARKMTFKHRVLELFLSQKLGFAADRVHEEASRLEHAASDEMIRRLYHLMGKPKADPHGSPIYP